MEQHVLSASTSKAFGPAGSLTVYDKATNTFGPTTPDEFLVEIDAHDLAIEKAFAAIETPASQAALRLTKYFKPRPTGVYTMDDEAGAFPTGKELAPVGLLEGVTLLVAGRVENWPRLGDRRLLAAYLALMYQRSPKLAEATRQWGIEFDAGAKEALAAELPWMRPDLFELLRSAKDRDLKRVALIGPRPRGRGLVRRTCSGRPELHPERLPGRRLNSSWSRRHLAGDPQGHGLRRDDATGPDSRLGDRTQSADSGVWSGRSRSHPDDQSPYLAGCRSLRARPGPGHARGGEPRG